MNHSPCTVSSVEGHLGCFKFQAIMNKATINIMGHMCVWYVAASFGYMRGFKAESSVGTFYVAVCFGYIPRGRTAESSVRTISNFLRNSQIDFQCSCTSL